MSQSADDSSLLDKIRDLHGDVETLEEALADLEPDMDDPVVAERVRAKLHGAATDPKTRDSWPAGDWHRKKTEPRQ